ELSAYPAFSPDGRWIVYSSDRGGGALHLWKQSLEGELSQLTTGDCNETEPDISSDGAWIAYHSDCSGGGVFLMRHSGGDARLIAHFGHSARFSPQGAHLVYWVQNQRTGFGMIYTARLDAPEEPLHVAREFDDAHNPVWTPDGKRLLICGTRRSRKGPDEEHDFWFLTFDGQPATKAGAFEKFAKSAINPHADILPTTSFRWIGDRELLVAIQQAGRSEIRRIVFDSAWRMTSDLPLMTAAMDETIHPFAAGSKLAFSTVRASIGVWSLALSPNEGRVTGGLRRLTGAREAVSPIVSPDGGTLLFSSPDGRRSFVLCKLDSKEGKVTELATLPGPSNRLKISPDGRTVYYRLLEGTGRQNQPIYAADVSSGATRKICSNCGPPTHVSPDGKLVIYEAPNTIARLSAVRVDTGESWVFLEHSHHAVTSGRVSPDGNFIAFQTDRGLDGKQVHVAPFRNAARIDESTWIPITFPDQWSEEPWWSPNGNYLYFLSQRDGWRCVWAQQVDQASMRAVGSPKAIQHFHHPGLNPLTFRNLAPLYVGLSVAQDQLVLSISEIRSNVWTAEIESVR
ncbi:MAG: TolB family protein, partial [Bryobacteraceae bacterium]